ncbi:PAS domain S-box protein [bacterium]|nr:PAS domain S-box protein [bacterium]
MKNFIEDIDYKILFENANDAIFIENIEGKILSANRKACEMFGYTYDEFLKLYASDLVPPDIVSELDNLSEKLKESKNLNIRARNVKKNGEIFDVDISLRLLEISGKPIFFAIVRDISDIVTLRQDYREQWENYKTLAELSQNAILVHNGRDVLFANSKVFDLFGIPYDMNLTMQSLLMLANPDSRATMNEYAVKRLSGESVPEQYEISGNSYGGNPLNLILNARKITYDGKPSLLVNFTDITEFRQMENRLIFLNTLLKTISKVNQLLVRESDIPTLMIEISGMLEEIRQYKKVIPLLYENGELVVPKNLDVDENFNRFIDIAKNLFLNVLESKEPLFTHDISKCENVSDEVREKYSNSNVKSVSFVPIAYKGNINGIIVVCANEGHSWSDEERNLLVEVSEDLGFAIRSSELEKEKNSALDKLAQSEKLYHTLVELAPIAIGLHDGEKMIFVNNATLKILGYDNIDEIIGHSIFDLVSSESIDIAHKRVKSMVDNGKPAESIEEILKKKDGTKIVAEVNATPVEIDGEKKVLIIARDITERKLAEEKTVALEQKLLQAQKLEAIGRLAGGIAHEFNNLLNGIIGYAELLKENLSVSEPAFRYTELIFKTSLDAARLTRQILSFGKRTPKEEIPFEIKDSIREVIDILKQTVPRNINFVLELFDENTVIDGDIAQIEQVLMNLCVNAFDAMPQGGDLTIKTDIVDADNITYSEIPHNKYVHLIVSDTGIGMSNEIIENIFDPFFTTKEQGKGTGLGLSIAYSIINDHNGYIIVNSEQGKGTAFEIFLPHSEEKSESKFQFATPEIIKGSETILVADDEAVMLNLLIDLLQSRGYRVLTAMNGVEAVKLYDVKKDEIDLVILDVAMPQMDGLEALNKILEIDSAAKILMVSGYTQIDTVDKCISAGAKGFIRKPFRIFELSEKIWNTLHK